MQSVIQKESCGSAKIFWLNKELLETRIKQAVRKLTAQHSEVEEVVFFGSAAESKATVSSDIDILIVVKDSKYRFLDRPLYFEKYFAEVGLGSDLFIYTQQELKNKVIPLAKTAFKKGKNLFIRKD